MESAFAVVVGLILIWIGFKIVKLVFKLILWGIAILLILGAIGYYYDSLPSSDQSSPQKREAPSKK